MASTLPVESAAQAAQRDVVARLRDALQARQPCAAVQWIETHLSHVLVTQDYAFKFRKAVALDFVDFTSIASRLHDCQEELRLNRRFSPELYLDVLPVTGTVAEPRIGGAGPAIDHVLRMRAFDQAGLWDRLAARGELRPGHVDALVTRMADMHDAAGVADPRGGWGTAQLVRQPLRDDLDSLWAWMTAPADRSRLAQLRQWEEQAYVDLAPVFEARLRAGRVRECHGDLHLGNVAEVHGRTTVFDCIEFSEAFRWIDVMSELAFMAMDLHCRGLHELAQRLVCGYLERTDDYDGARVLRYYMVHRALVRAKVAWLRATQQSSAAPRTAARRQLAFALRCIHRRCPVLMITHGYSGAGKTTLTQGLVDEAGAVRIRADVLRKRLAGVAPLARGHDALLYSEVSTRATYAGLFDRADAVLRGGCSVVLDATFLQRSQRDAARRFAAERGVRCVILDFDADLATLQDRIVRRAARGDDASDADLAVLAQQVRTSQPLTSDERVDVFSCRGTPVQADWSELLQSIGVRGVMPQA